jgi:hypothetical protein
LAGVEVGDHRVPTSQPIPALPDIGSSQLKYASGRQPVSLRSFTPR